MSSHYFHRPRSSRARTAALAAALIATVALLFAAPALALGPPIVSKTSISKVSETSATLNATLDPNDRKTEYHFEYITEADYQAAGEEFGAGAQSTPTEEITNELSIEHSVSTTLTGLPPAGAYRFRLVAHNSKNEPPGSSTFGETVTFATYPAAPVYGPCPNAAYRGGPSARLPDCRAYEQATPQDKNGTDIEGTLFSIRASLTGDAITSYTLSGLPGGSGFQNTPAYISRRVGGAWSTAGALPPASYGDNAEVEAWTPDLAFSFSRASISGSPGRALLVRDSSDGLIATLIPYTSGASYTLVGTSSDDSKIFFESTTALAPGALTGKSNLYRYDRDSGTTTLVDVLPAAEGGQAPPAGAFAGPYNWFNGTDAGTLGEGGAGAGYFLGEERAISADGQSAYFTVGGSGQLYLRRGIGDASPETMHVSASHKKNGAGEGGKDAAGAAPAAFQLASPDGSAALFTSSEKLTDESNTGPEPEPAAIGRAKLNGAAAASEEEPGFLSQKAAGVATGGEYVYWTNPVGGTIGRAKLGPSGPEHPEPAFIVPGETCFETHPETEPGVVHCAPSTPRYVAVGNGYVYWTNTGPLGGDANKSTQLNFPLAGAGTIGRAKINPTTKQAEEIKPEFMIGAGSPQGIAVNSEHIYWINSLKQNCASGRCLSSQLSIARAGIEGNAIEENFYNPPSIFLPYGISLSTTDIYWTFAGSGGEGGIYRIPLEGTDEFPDAITLSAGGGKASGITLDGTSLYWASQSGKAIGRLPLADFPVSGFCGEIASCETEFIKTPGVPIGLATDPSGERIYWSTNGETPPNPGADLYRFEAETENLTDLTPDPSAENGAEVVGVLGASQDLSYLYFAANGVLASNEGAQGSHASPGDCAGRNDNWLGTCNLYLRHSGEITFVARLRASSDLFDWLPVGFAGNGSTQQSEARVSADGRTLLFASAMQQSAYDNQDASEFYRYDADSGEVECLSCNPTGAPPVFGPSLKERDLNHTGTSHFTYAPQPFLSHNLSPDGNRFFFQTAEKLVAADVNGESGCPLNLQLGSGPSCLDVYEWEAPGEGSCSEGGPAFSPSNGGCLYLISTGTGTYPSNLAEVSADGRVAFFFTRDQLVPADEDENQDIYAATVEGGLASQHEVARPPCEGEACRGAGTSAPQTSGAGSASFSGPGDKAQPHLLDCGPTADRAQEIARLSKSLRRRANHAQSPALAKSLRQRSKELAKRAHGLSKDAKRCRSANRKASR